MKKFIYKIIFIIFMLTIFLFIPNIFSKATINYNLWIGGVQVTSENSNKIIGNGINGTVSYNVNTNTLTLNNASITKYYLHDITDTNYSGSGIYTTENINIEVKGKNYIYLSTIDKTSDVPKTALYSTTNGITCLKNLNFKGDGKLNVLIDKAQSISYGISANRITINENTKIDTDVTSGNVCYGFFSNSDLNVYGLLNSRSYSLRSSAYSIYSKTINVESKGKIVSSSIKGISKSAPTFLFSYPIYITGDINIKGTIVVDSQDAEYGIGSPTSMQNINVYDTASITLYGRIKALTCKLNLLSKNFIIKAGSSKDNSEIISLSNLTSQKYVYIFKNTTHSKISKKSLLSSSVSGIKDKAYTGKEIKQSIKVKLNGTTLKEKTDYTIFYNSNKNVGTATIIIKGKGNYEKTITKTFKINPKNTSNLKLKKKSKAFTASWKKYTTEITGYEIQYSRNKNFKSSNKTIKITKTKTTSTTVMKLKAKKKYYVRIRTYKKVNGTKYYSNWSNYKSVTTKK